MKISVIYSKNITIGAIIACMSFALLVLNSNLLSSVSAQTANSSSITWSTYSNKKLGISFEYPSTWTVEEKKDRFDTHPDVMVVNEQGNPLQSFKFTNHIKGLDSSMKVLGLKYVANYLQTLMLNTAGSRPIEDVSTDKYIIAGLPTASYLVSVPFLNAEVGRQVFTINNHGIMYTLAYDDTREDFDSPGSQITLNHILNSFKFL